MLTSARIASATASANAAVDVGSCLNHTVVAFGIVYLFQIESCRSTCTRLLDHARQTIRVARGTPPLTTRIFLCRRSDFRRTAECRAELPPRADVELAVDAAEVLLHGLHGHKERLGDLLVAHVLRCHLRDPPLTRREFVEPTAQDRSRVGAGRGEFFVPPVDQGGRAAAMREVDSLTQMFSCLAATVHASEQRAQIDERAGVLEAGRRPRQYLDRFPEDLLTGLCSLDEPERVQRDANCARSTPRS